MRKNDAFDAKIVNTRLTKIFIAIFAPHERLPSSATLLNITIMSFVGEKEILFNWRKKAWNGDDQDEKAEQAT